MTYRFICYCPTLLLSLAYADYTKSCLYRNSTPRDNRFSKNFFTYDDSRHRWLPSLGLVARFPRSSVFGRLTPPLHRSTSTATHPHSTSGSWQLCQVVGFNTSLLAALKHLALGNLEELFRCSTSRNSLSMTHPIPSHHDPSILVKELLKPILCYMFEALKPYSKVCMPHVQAMYCKQYTQYKQ